jgi:hypothetical protein
MGDDKQLYVVFLLPSFLSFLPHPPRRSVRIGAALVRPPQLTMAFSAVIASRAVNGMQNGPDLANSHHLRGS